MAGLMILLGDLQSPGYEANIMQSGLDPGRRFLLKGVQHVHDFLETHGVDRPVSVAVIVFDQFEDARALALPGLGGAKFQRV
jgi:hypothetical protein